MSSVLYAQNRTVRGTVTDDLGEPVIGATVRVNGTQRTAVTDINGSFSIQASPKEKIRISYVGFKEVVVTATSQVNVQLQEDNSLMDEVVVVGYGTQKKATLTGAVSSVTNKEMTVTKNENVINMLAGKVSGVRITQQSSQPGADDTRIDIRGFGDPIVVVDDIIRDKGYFSRMDPNEIESVSVLKDASATIYGVQAANGVLLVTTKHGSSTGKDKFDITFSANFGWQNFLYLPSTASAADHMLLINEKKYNSIGTNYPYRSDPTYSYEEMFAYTGIGSKGTNWTNELFDTNVPQEQYNVSLNGSSNKIDYFVNLGYLDQMGSYTSQSMNYHRWNFRSNVDARITDRLKATVMLSAYMDERNEPHTDIWTVYKKAWTYRPNSEAWIDGDHSLPGWDDNMLENDNPVATTNSDLTGYRRYKSYDVNLTFQLRYDVPWVKGLYAKGMYSYVYNNSDNTEYKRQYNVYNKSASGELQSFERNTDSSLRRSTSPSYMRTAQLSLNYENSFGDHNLKLLALFEENYHYWDNFFASRVMLLDSEYLYAGENENKDAGSDMGGIWDMTRRGFVGRINYDYAGRYILELACREDGSSKWSSGHRWGFFPSASIGWRISEEPFMKKLVPFIDNFKLRASYGKMGDDGVGGHYPPTVIGYNIEATRYGWFYDNAVMSGVSPTAVPNYNLTWYTATTKNLGLDWDLWNGKLGGTFEVFKRNRDGLLGNRGNQVPGTVGASLPQENLNSDMTFGWELQLSHRNRVGKLNYWLTGQISATKNRWDVMSDNSGENSINVWRNRLDQSGRNKDIWMSVEEGGRFSSYEQIQNHSTPVSQNTLPGDYYYEDWNGDGIIDGNDSHPMATYNLPVFNYGFSAGLECRGFDFSMSWQGAAKVYNQYGEVFAEVGPFNGGAVLDIYLDRWHTANVDDDPWNPHTQWVEGYYPATGHSFNDWGTAIRNTSYLRMKSIELGYTLPKELTSKVGMSEARIYVNGYNLLTFTGLKNMDPERPGSRGINGSGENASLFYRYPINKTINVGATLKF